MPVKKTDNLRIKTLKPLISPAILMEELPLTEIASHVVSNTRLQVSNIIHGKDPRLLVIVGPCSIHDPIAAMEYAELLQKQAQRFSEELCIIMRVYFEKPRTTIGWKGLINDPKLNNSFEINNGLRIARKLLLDINNQGLPAGTEFLDTIIPQYISDLISWGAIGARTTESQIHRELASGLSMPIGFKNGTTGDIQIAIDAIGAAQHPHHFLSVTSDGISAIVATMGNDDCHIILRGSTSAPNYDNKTIRQASQLLQEAKLHTRIMVDCSHGNSRKDHNKQMIVAKSICEQIENGNNEICGVMLESNLKEGKQVLHDKALNYGQSITDACLSWQQTLPLFEMMAETVKTYC